MADSKAFILFDEEVSPIGGGLLEFDASVNEGHTASATVTEHPVEVGSNITDHVIQRPDKLELTAIIANRPIGIFLFDPIDVLADEGDRAERAFEVLRDLKEAGTTLFIFTNLRTYDNMVITNLNVPRDKDTGNILRVDISFTEIRLVQALEAEIGPAAPTQSNGKQPTTAAGDATDEQAGIRQSTWDAAQFGDPVNIAPFGGL